tara:strand:+ start:647 stop:1225 length:579 start_codon:yes stop_codon:yes gene_type:complete
MSSVIKKLLKEIPEHNNCSFKIGKSTKHYFNTNLSKAQFYDILEIYSKNAKKNNYIKKSSFKYYNRVLDIVNGKQNYYELNNFICKELSIGDNKFLLVSDKKDLIPLIEMPSINLYHNSEIIEEIIIELSHNLKLYFRKINNEIYQICIDIVRKNNEDVERISSVIMETLNNINYLLNETSSDIHKYINMKN